MDRPHIDRSDRSRSDRGRSGITRRSFLAAAGGGVALAAATANPVLARVAGAQKAISPLVLSSDLYAAPEPQRFVFAIQVGRDFASTAPAQVAFLPPGAARATTVATRLYRDGLPKGRGVYRADAVFDVPGTGANAWRGIVVTRGRKVPFAFEVQPQPVAPPRLAPAPRAPSPTAANPLGVDPICTRRPPCPLHAVSLADVIGTGKPVAAMFATPALCQSMYCGPVLDELLSVRSRYEDRITFVHVEIYASTTGATRAPTVVAWGLESEPWLYTIDGAGTIVGRIDGAFGREEIVAQLDALVARS